MNQAGRDGLGVLAVSNGITTVSPRLARSWRRSASFGVAPDVVSPSYVGRVDDESVMVVSAHRVLRDIGRTLADEPVGLMYTDAEGVVLGRTCGNANLLRALDDACLATGFGCSEREIGTAGPGLTLADREPSLVSAVEHYCAGLWVYSSAAAPIADPFTGELIGTVALVTWSGRSHAFLLALAVSAARGTEAQMSARLRGSTPPGSRGAGRRVTQAIAEDTGSRSGTNQPIGDRT